MTSKLDLVLPVGEYPDWELGDSENEESTKSVSESNIILQSLKQSRERWIHQTFPRFSTRSRGTKVIEAAHPPHTINTRGKCDLHIGPHIFPDTVIYEVNYLAPMPATSNTPHTTTSHNPAWQSNAPYNPQVQPPVRNTAVSQAIPLALEASAPPPPPAEKSSTPLMSSLTDAGAIAPELINKVNQAASSNPILSALLQSAAAGKASPDQLKTLGLLIQSLASIEDAAALAATPKQPFATTTPSFSSYYQSMPSIPPIRECDLVIEFREAPTERWLFPRVSVFGERVPSSTTGGTNHDILLTAGVPFTDTKGFSGLASQGAQAPAHPDASQHSVTFQLKSAPVAVWDTIYRWIGGEEKLKANKEVVEKLKPPKRSYLPHRLPPGSLLTQVQTACAPSYALKPLKQGPSAPPRAPRQRKSQAIKRPADESTFNVVVGEETPSKRARASQSRPSSGAQIQCHSCGQTDVPLILGGRYCRPCVDAGRSVSIPAPLPQTS